MRAVFTTTIISSCVFMLSACDSSTSSAPNIVETNMPSGIFSASSIGEEVAILYIGDKTTSADLKSTAQTICAKKGLSVGTSRNAAIAHPESFPPNTKKVFFSCD